MAGDQLRFTILGEDRLSAAFSGAGASVSRLTGKMDFAARYALVLDEALKRQASAAWAGVDATLTLAKADKILEDAEHGLAEGALEAEFALKREREALHKSRDAALEAAAAHRIFGHSLSGGGGGGAGGGGISGGLFGGLSRAASLAATPGPFGVPLGGWAAGMLASPWLAQLTGAGLVFGLGGGLAGLGIAGALGTGKTVTAAQLAAAQDALAAAQLRAAAAQAALARKPGPAAQAALVSAQGAVVTAQARLTALQAGAQDPAQLAIRKAFANLSNDAQDSLARIGKSFQPVMLSIFRTADSTLARLTPVFAGAVKIISGPFQVFADTIIKAFEQPAVVNSINAVAKAFAILLKTLTPAIPGMVRGIATGITGIANAVAKNPKAFADFVQFLFKAGEFALIAIADLTRVASYVEKHWVPVFDGARHEIAHIWEDIGHDTMHIWDVTWKNTIGRTERGFHDTAYWFGRIRHGIAAAWDTIWNNTVGRVSRGVGDVVTWFKGLPGKITSNLGKAGSLLWSWGKGVIQGLLDGMGSIIGSVWKFIQGIPGKILSFLGIHSPPQWAIDAGKHIMNGIGIGMSQAQAAFGSAAGAAVGRGVTAALGGLAAGPAQAYARSLLGAFGWGPGQFPALAALWTRESGWNPWAVNPSSGAYGIPQALPSAWGRPYALGDWAAQVRWGLSYIAGRYGSPAAAWAHELASGWYGSGLDAMFTRPTLIGVGDVPERVTITPGAGHRGGATYNVSVMVHPAATANPKQTGAEIARYVTEFIRGGGRIYPPGTTPR